MLDKVENLIFLRRKEVEAMTGLSRSSIYASMGNGTFPKATKIGARSVRWLQRDIIAWMNNRITESRGMSLDAGKSVHQ